MECTHDLPYWIGDRWTAHVLRAMEREGTVSREAFAENPPRVEYELTEQGRKVLGLLDLCCDWARENLVET